MNPEYFVIVDSSEECTIWVTTGSQNYVLNSGYEKPKPCKAIKIKEVMSPRECVLFEHGNRQHTGRKGEGNHGVWYHLRLIREDVDLKNAVTVAYGDSKQRNVQNKRKFSLSAVRPIYLPDEKGIADNKTSRNTVPV